MGYTAGMTTTPAEARQIADAFLAEERPWATSGELLEDTEDYFVGEVLKPGQQWPLGPGAIFISKESGAVRSEAWGNAFDQINAMTPVPAS